MNAKSLSRGLLSLSDCGGSIPSLAKNLLVGGQCFIEVSISAISVGLRWLGLAASCPASGIKRSNECCCSMKPCKRPCIFIEQSQIHLLLLVQKICDFSAAESIASLFEECMRARTHQGEPQVTAHRFSLCF